MFDHLYFNLQGIINSRRILIFLAISLFVLVIFEIWVLNRLSTFGEQIVKIEISSGELKKENQLLENQVAEMTSLLVIEAKARMLGLSKSKRYEYIKPQELEK